jgi:hypothetical protein
LVILGANQTASLKRCTDNGDHRERAGRAEEAKFRREPFASPKRYRKIDRRSDRCISPE